MQISLYPFHIFSVQCTRQAKKPARRAERKIRVNRMENVFPRLMCKRVIARYWFISLLVSVSSKIYYGAPMENELRATNVIESVCACTCLCATRKSNFIRRPRTILRCPKCTLEAGPHRDFPFLSNFGTRSSSLAPYR